MKAEVVVREDVSAFVPSPAVAVSAVATTNNSNSTYSVQEYPPIIVRPEEVILVVLVLILWVAAIVLFFNRWGKIRMLEPYQPKFQGPHRQSCPIPVDTGVNTGCSISDLRKQRMSFSKFNVNCLGDPLFTGLGSPRPPQQRLRQNSVFVNSTTMNFTMSPPRRAKSAMDIHNLIQTDQNPKQFYNYRSMQPMRIDTSPIKENPIKDRKPSITIDRPRRKPSMCHEFSCYFPLPRHRPSSTFSDYRQYGRSKFKSFDQPSCSWERNPKIDRRLSTAFERSKSRNRPSISLERPAWDRRPSVTIEPPPPNEESDTEDETSACIKRTLKKQTTINVDATPRISSDKTSVSLDQATTSTCSSLMSYERRPSFTLDRGSSNDTGANVSGCQRLSVSLDQPALKWEGNTPTFMIERPTPSPQPTVTPTVELRFLEAETESLQVTNV